MKVTPTAGQQPICAKKRALPGRVLGDKNMAAALIDRTVHHGRLVRFEGGSYRSEHALMTR